MPFETGKSHYPDGRKLQAAIQRRARAEAQQSIAALATIRDDPRASTELRAQAAFELLALANFKPAAQHRMPAMAAS